jgi:hypothetical protein
MLYRDIMADCEKHLGHRLYGRNAKLTVYMLKQVVRIITDVFKVIILLFVVHNLPHNMDKLVTFVFVACQSIPAVGTRPQTAVPIKQRLQLIN